MDYHNVFLEVINNLWDYFAGLVNAVFPKQHERSNKHVMKKTHQQRKVKILGCNNRKDTFLVIKLRAVKI